MGKTRPTYRDRVEHAHDNGWADYRRALRAWEWRELVNGTDVAEEFGV